MKKQVTNMEVKKNNRNRIFRYICAGEKISNPDIAYELKVSLPTVMQNTKELIERGLVSEVGELESTGGRRAKALSINANAKLAIGLNITRNHVGFVLTNLVGKILKYDRINLRFIMEDKYYCEINRRMQIFLAESKMERERILGIGISIPGIINVEKKEITYSHALEIEAVPFDKISQFFEYPCYFLNDANAGAYAEGLRSKKDKRFFYLSLSNTVGGAIFDQGIVQGDHFRCGEVGHMTIVPEGDVCYCGKKGCFDVYCSAGRLADTANGKLEKFFANLTEGDESAESVWDTYTSYLALAINNVHMMLDCDVVIGGYVGSCIETQIQDIREKVAKRNTFTTEGEFVKTCNYKVGTAALGAALIVIEKFIEQV